MEGLPQYFAFNVPKQTVEVIKELHGIRGRSEILREYHRIQVGEREEAHKLAQIRKSLDCLPHHILD